MTEPEEKKSDKPRRRMRAAYAKIRDQMEFYFSDANLHKDRFLKKTIEATTDGYIPLDLFLQFNRIKALTEDKEVIADALNNKSDLLKINEARTHVKRVTEIKKPVNVDERTIYVECIPSHADHDWVRRIFTSCGKVLYVSLPRYQSTGDLKGFAFVEFESIEAAHNACEELNNPPAELHKFGAFPKSSHQIEALRKKIPEDQFNEQMKDILEPSDLNDQQQQSENKTADVIKSPITNKESKSKRMRTLNESDTEHGSGTDVAPSKRKKSEVNIDLPSEDDDKKSNSNNKKCRKRKMRSKTEEETEMLENIPEKKTKIDDETDIKEDVTEIDKKVEHVEKSEKEVTSNKKKRSRKKKPKTSQELPELRVISKKEWLELRKEYLQLQKASMALLKKTISKEEKVLKQKEEKRKHAPMEFVADVIVKVTSDNPMNRKDLKKSLGEDYNVAYIDVKDDTTEGYIRCIDKDSAQRISQCTCTGYIFNMVTGDAEKQYWDKLILDRETKLNTKGPHKKRGQQKWMNKAQKLSIENTERKHIIFDDD